MKLIRLRINTAFKAATNSGWVLRVFGRVLRYANREITLNVLAFDIPTAAADAKGAGAGVR